MYVMYNVIKHLSVHDLDQRSPPNTPGKRLCVGCMCECVFICMFACLYWIPGWSVQLRSNKQTDKQTVTRMTGHKEQQQCTWNCLVSRLRGLEQRHRSLASKGLQQRLRQVDGDGAQAIVVLGKVPIPYLATPTVRTTFTVVSELEGTAQK